MLSILHKTSEKKTKVKLYSHFYETRYKSNRQQRQQQQKKVQPKSESKMYAIHPPAHKEKRMKNKSQTKKNNHLHIFILVC